MMILLKILTMHLRQLRKHKNMTEYIVTKSKRKTISIQVKADGSVVVKAPVFLSNGEIQKFVMEKENWIVRKQQEMRERNASVKKIGYTDGEMMLFQGRSYVLQVIKHSFVKAARITVKNEESILLVEIPSDGNVQVESDAVRSVILNWYVTQAAELIPQRVKYFHQYSPEEIHNVTIKDQKTRWGSCSSKHNLNFNWRLILVPSEVLDYVVVHEISHLRHMNHSKEFWKEVERVLPQYKASEKWLKENGNMLFMYS